jgi:rubrerythrin
MDETRKKLLDALRRAIEAEYEGYGFYLMAAKSTEDEQGRTIFRQLAEEEQQHAAYLKTQHKAITETGHVDPQAKLGSPLTLAARSPIFSADLKRRLGDAHFEMSALGVGVHLEQSAMEFYAAQARDSTDAAVRAFFRELSDWEAGHYHALLAQQQELQSGYWEKNGFAPF